VSSRRRAVVATIACVALLACRQPPASFAAACRGSIEPAVVVVIRDAATGTPLAQRAWGVVRDGLYTDSLRPNQSETADQATLFSRRAADERPGTYDVEVRAEGYRTWQTRGVRVGRDACHVRTVVLHARLASDR
jgi:hypothetical protein